MSLPWILIIVLGPLVAAYLASFVVEALRVALPLPEALVWAPNIAVQFVDAVGAKLRYIKTGSEPNVVLLHTLRPQLELFERVVPDLAKDFTVFALEYPGHGYSYIPAARYDADFFVRSVESFLDALDLHEATLCGVSIGGSIALITAGRRKPRVARVVAVNPYDYFRGRGMARSSFLGWTIVATSEIPFVGETAMRLRNFVIMKAVLQGGVAAPGSIRPALMKEMYGVGNRRVYYRAFISLLRNAASRETATEIYRHINVPVCLVWGDRIGPTLQNGPTIKSAAGLADDDRRK